MTDEYEDPDGSLEQASAFAWEHRDHFAEVAAHNLEVTIRRLQRKDWDAPQNQYRNAWQELEHLTA